MFILDSIKSYAKTGRTALMSREENLSFTELDTRSEAFAVWLLERFGDSRKPVVIYGHKETDFLSCVFGALKSGRAYVPVDTAIPPDRAAEIAGDISPDVIVDFSGSGFQTGAAVLDGGALKAILHSPVSGEVSRDTWVSGDATAYILFTSGSTGKPKGVPITAANLYSFYRGLLPYMGDKDGGVILNQVSYSFDVSCCSVYAGLARGMTLLTVDKEMLEDMGALFDRLRGSGLTRWVSTPSFAEVCVRSKTFSSELAPYLSEFLFCGEVLTHKLCDQLAERFPKSRILNTYGPTEATVLVTAVWLTKEMRRAKRPVPIGCPISGTKLRLVDANGQDVENDEECGELLIIGDSVGHGYYGRPDLTAERFFRDGQTGVRGYRTGDIAYRKDGLYYFCGRADNQLKLNGYRVEIEDVENNLARIENISRAAVVPVLEDGRVQYLAAFILLEKDDGLSALKRSISIKKLAAAYLPVYMIPHKFIAVDTFPLNTNGKIDKKELAARLRKAEPE